MGSRTLWSPRQRVNDTLVKDGSDLNQHDKSASYKDEKTVIKSLTARKWHQKHPDINSADGYHYLDRANQVILIRLRTGHNRMNAHMYSKLKIGRITVLSAQPRWLAKTCSKIVHFMMFSGGKDGQRTPLWGTYSLVTRRLCGGHRFLFEWWATPSSVRRRSQGNWLLLQQRNSF